MGKVYLATHALLHRKAAIKLLDTASVDADFIEHFEHEVQYAAELTHPNTIQIYDYGHSDDGIFYFVMEYLPGINLAELVAQDGPLPSPVHFQRLELELP